MKQQFSVIDLQLSSNSQWGDKMVHLTLYTGGTQC